VGEKVPPWRADDMCRAVRDAHNATFDACDRIHRAQNKLLLAMLELEKLPEEAGRRLRQLIVDAAAELGLPPETWDA
jgi:hypothetical protein